MYESRDANPFYQSADLDFDAARAEWERQGEPAGEPERETPTFAPGDQVVRRSHRYTTTGTVVTVEGGQVKVRWHPGVKEYWIESSLLVYAEHTPPGESPTDTPEQTARAAIASYREFTERYSQSPDEATESAVREVLEGLAVDVQAIRAELAARPGPTPGEMKEWPL